MARRAIDLSQPLSRESQLHPFFAPTQIMRHIQHTDAAEGDPSFAAELIITSNHAATHVDAFAHYDKSADAPLIADMPLDTFWGPALCVDIRQYERGHDITAAQVEQAVEASGQELREHDILVFCTDHYNRTAGHPGLPRRLRRHLGRGGALDGGPQGEDLRRRDDQPRPRLPHRPLPLRTARAPSAA